MVNRMGELHCGFRQSLPGRLLAVLAALAFLFAASGCQPETEPDRGANQSLVEIGERSMEEAEVLEAQGKIGNAHLAYKRSLWAFEYHEKLTGEEPLLLDEVLDGLERTRKD